MENDQTDPCSYCDYDGEELMIEHGESEQGMRMTCPCGASSSWEISFEAVYQVWNNAYKSKTKVVTKGDSNDNPA